MATKRNAAALASLAVQGSKSSSAEGEPQYVLCLYLAGSTAASARAIVNTRRFCEQYLQGRYDLQIVDVSAEPSSLASGQIVAVPTLVKLAPLPMRRFIGDMSQTERLLRGFDLRADPIEGG